jgi:chemotaxis methyl-accepting protein methylase
MIKITPDEYKVASEYIYELSGITLEANKTYLVEARLSPLVEAYGCATFSEFYYRAKADRSQTIENGIVDAITTQETLFFRDMSPFELLQYKILPDLIDMKQAQGALIIGSSECMGGTCDRFKSNRHLRSVYYTLTSGADVSSGRPVPSSAVSA